MKIRAIGTGSKFCRHPLVPTSFLVSSGKDLTLIGAPWSVVPALERYGYNIQDISVITALSPQIDQIAGLVELAYHFRNKPKKPILACTAKIIEAVRERIEPEIGFFLDDAFSVKSVKKIIIKEEYYSEEIVFVQNFMHPNIPSIGLRFESSKVFIAGETKLNEDWLYKEMGCDLILHGCSTQATAVGVNPTPQEIQELPMYLQTKMWLYGYDADAKESEQPFPMMFLPPGSWIYDSERRDKLLSKERFIRENSKKQY